MKAGSVLWAARHVAVHGWPRRLLTTYSGVGDQVMSLAAMRELGPRARGDWLMLKDPELAADSGVHCAVLRWELRTLRMAERLHRPIVELGYLRYEPQTDQDHPLPGHAIATLARQAGATGRIALKPHLVLTAAEAARGRRFEGRIVIQNSSAGALTPMQTKQWEPGRFQALSDRLRERFGVPIVQLGTSGEPPLTGVLDLRGQTGLREAAAVLGQARLFIGLTGGLMHLARAVDCPAVIVYGGREEPRLAGYSGFRNLVCQPECSPCHYRNRCPHAMRCMTGISVETVFAAAAAELEGERRAPPLDYGTIP